MQLLHLRTHASHTLPDYPTKVSPPTPDEIGNLLLSLSKGKSWPAILSLVDDYSSPYIPKYLCSLNLIVLLVVTMIFWKQLKG